jgi:hypothetical protein
VLKQICPLLQVRDLEGSVLFYREKLGFQAAATDGSFCILMRDDCTIFLAQKSKNVDVTNKAARADPEDGWCTYDLHIYCQPGTLNALYEEFRTKGVRMPQCFHDGPILRSYGIRDFSVFDPDGYDLVFGEECPDDA